MPCVCCSRTGPILDLQRLAAPHLSWSPRASDTTRSADAGMKTERAILDAMRLTIELGHDVNAVNEFDQTALHGAVYRGMNGLIQFLVDRGAALDPKDALGRTPRELAQEGLGRGQIHRDEQSSFLLELGAVSE